MRRMRKTAIKCIRIRRNSAFAAIFILGGLIIWILYAVGADKAADGFLSEAVKNDDFTKKVMEFEFDPAGNDAGSSDSGDLLSKIREIASENEKGDGPGEQVPEHSPTSADIDDISENSDLGGNTDVQDNAGNGAINLQPIPESVLSLSDISVLLKQKPVTSITIKPQGNISGVSLKNETKYGINLEELYNKKLNIKLSGSGPQVLIIHTHGSEAYTTEGKNTYTPDDNDRTLNKNYNVMKVGDQIEGILKKNGINVVHIKDFFDYPTYNGSYTRSLKAISEQMKKTPSIKVIIDVHRDAMIASDGTKYKTVAEINKKTAAQLMFVAGTDEGGLSHDKWRENLSLMVKLQKMVEDKYPGLMRPINLRRERFNQHATTGSMLIEVGTSGNTLDEALYTAELFAGVLSDELKKLK